MLHCAVCVNTTKPPWPAATASHAGYQLCGPHHEQLVGTNPDSTIVELLNHIKTPTRNASMEAT